LARTIYIYIYIWLRHFTKLPWREIKTRDTGTKNGLQALIKSKQRKEARNRGGKPIIVEKRHMH
jgi:hypothetical protein